MAEEESPTKTSLAGSKILLSSSRSQDDSKLLECAICLDQYRDPRVLPCGHTFCLLCLKTYAATVKRSSGVQLSCCLCKAPWFEPNRSVEELPRNEVSIVWQATMDKIVRCVLLVIRNRTQVPVPLLSIQVNLSCTSASHAALQLINVILLIH